MSAFFNQLKYKELKRNKLHSKKKRKEELNFLKQFLIELIIKNIF